MFDKEALFKATLEMLRVCFMGAIPVIIDGVTQGRVDYRLVAAAAFVAGLRFVDKWLHEIGKAMDNESLSKGLTRF